MQRSLIVAAVLAAASYCDANEPGPPPITRETLVGSWQAVAPYQPIVYRLEVRRDGSSYLAYMWGNHPVMCRLVSSDVRHGKVVLRFHPMRGTDINFDEVLITAMGSGDTDRGFLTGEIRFKWPDDKDYVEAVAFSRPQWVQLLPPLAKLGEELLKRAQRQKQ